MMKNVLDLSNRHKRKIGYSHSSIAANDRFLGYNEIEAGRTHRTSPIVREPQRSLKSRGK